MTNVKLAPIKAKTCVVRDTAKRKGRHISVTPKTTAARNLHFGRIVLAAHDAPVKFSTGSRETGLLCLEGNATIEVDDNMRFEIGRYDAVYAPRGSGVKISGNCDIAEIAAPVKQKYPVQVVRFDAVQKDPALHFKTGGPSAQREVNIVIGKNVDAGRILAGVTFSHPGNWTSWPPHEHARMLEEAYLYIDMPEPGWGVQFVYNDPKNPELVAVVHQDDVVLMPQGYHPNVSAPGSTINFVWMMAAIREGEDRQFGVVNVQPEYAEGGSGLEASRK